MNNKKFFIGLSLIEIIFGIYTIINRNSILENQIEQLKSMASFEYINSIIEKMNVGTVIINAVIGIAIAIFIFYIASKDEFKENRTKLIILSILGYVFSSNTYAGLLYIVGLIVTLCIPTEKKERVKEKKEIKCLKKHDTSNRDVMLGIGFILLYLSDNVWSKYIPKSLGVPIVFAFELLLIVLALLLYKDDLKRDFKELKNNFGVYFKYCLKTWGLMLLSMIVIGIVIAAITGEVKESTNQQMLKTLPLFYLIPSAIIMAPIVEETIFRCVFRKIFRNDTLFIVISAICFGLLHVVVETNIMDALVSSISYIVMGGFLARSYVKTNNMTVSMIIHCMQNTMACILMLLM